MRATIAQAAHLLLLAGAVHALPEIAITKHRHADFNPARLRRRQDSGGTVETNTYDVLTWSTGGAYYANGESLSCGKMSSVRWHERSLDTARRIRTEFPRVRTRLTFSQ